MRKISLFNSLSKKKEEFTPINPPEVSMYCCGFTVYDHTHLGHIKKYIGDDIIRRVLEFNGYKVTHVQNVTDVGHLVSDSDEGIDKMEKGAQKYGMTVWEVAKKYEKEFFDTMDQVGALKPHIIENAASDKSISEQISNIRLLVDTNYAYITPNAIYFDVSKLKEYNPFSSQSLEDKISGSRDDVVTDSNKKHPADFALWVFTVGEHANHVMRWDSPWGEGFPGWHIECSTISISNLGERIDIHTGGLDHQYIHHPNEIAQNEALTGHKVVNYWMHHNFLVVNGKKMSKSLGNFYTLQDLLDKKFNPYALRYLILGVHYRQQMNFTWESMQSAQTTYESLLKKYAQLVENAGEKSIPIDEQNKYWVMFVEAINDDFNIPKAIGIMWDMLRDSNLDDLSKLSMLIDFDKIFGFDIKKQSKIFNTEVDSKKLPTEIKDLLEEREQARQNKDWANSDKLRDKILEKGYKIEDTSEGSVISKI